MLSNLRISTMDSLRKRHHNSVLNFNFRLMMMEEEAMENLHLMLAPRRSLRRMLGVWLLPLEKCCSGALLPLLLCNSFHGACYSQGPSEMSIYSGLSKEQLMWTLVLTLLLKELRLIRVLMIRLVELGAGIGNFTGELVKEARQVLAMDFIQIVIKKGEHDQ